MRLSDLEAAVFAYACQKENITVTDVRAMSGVSVSNVRTLMDRLVVQKLLEPLDKKSVYTLSRHGRERLITTLIDDWGGAARVRPESGQSWGRVRAESG